MSAPLVSLRNVAAGYNGIEVLSGVSMNIHDGDFVGITGPNGGGKTTLMKVITGLLPHSTGSIEYSNRLIVNDVRRIGYLPQQNIFDRSFPISVIDVVVSGLQAEKGFVKRYTRTDFNRARKIMAMSNISELERSPIGEISGGQMQRALLCRALIIEPRLLILDEPTTYVDSRFEGELLELLLELNSGKGRRDDRTTIVMVSHDAAAIAGVAKSVVHVDGTIRNSESRLIAGSPID